MPTTLAKLEHDLRRSAEARQYADVQSLATAFCQAAEAHMASLGPQDPERAKTAGKVAEVLDWTLLMMLTARASCLEEFSRALVANRYLQQADGTDGRVRVNL
jgi:hypothetical protein